jgi:BNR repeat-containing family member
MNPRQHRRCGIFRWCFCRLTVLLVCLIGALPGRAIAGPAVTLVPINDGDPNTSEYGYAGDPDDPINAVAFICSGLMTVGNQQFVAYYGRHQTNTTYIFNNKIWIGRRTVGSNLWEVFRTTLAPNDINDGHDVVSFGIDGDGYMHLSWGMHGNSFLYTKSTGPVTGNQSIAFGPATTMTGGENNVTYPQFLTLPNGDLLFIFREGTSGAGDTFINRYDHLTQTWTNQQYNAGQKPFIKGTGWLPVDYNCYPSLPCLDTNGNLFFIWVWRDNPAYQSNHDFSFARSTNGGLTWLRYDGTPYALPISAVGENGDTNTTADRVLTVPMNSSLINQAGMCLDQSGNPVVAAWWAPGTPTNNYRRQYMIIFRSTNGWAARQVSQRTMDPTNTMFSDSFVRDLGRPVVVTDKDDRIIVLYRDNQGSNGLTVAHSLPRAVDPDRLTWTTMDLTIDNLGAYEPVIDVARWNRDNVMHILYQPCTGHGYTAPSNTAAPIGVLEWNAAAYFAHRPPLHLSISNRTNAVLSFDSQMGWDYRVQTATNLSNWITLTTLSGTGNTLQNTQTNVVNGVGRYWRLEIKEGGFP